MLIRCTIALFSLTFVRALAQDGPAAVCDRVRAADSCLRQKDTVMALQYWEEADSLCPVDGISQDVCLKMGDIYITQGRRQDAGKILQKGLTVGHRVRCYCENNPNYFYRHVVAQSNICFKLSELYSDSQDSVFKYVVWADTKYRPLFACGNASEDYHAKIAPRVAQVYLDKGDTAMAYARLNMSLLFGVDPAKKLKPLLLLRHTQQDIDRELKRCIYHPQKTRDKEGKKVRVYTFFGYEIIREDAEYKNHRKRVGDYLMRVNRGIVFMRSPSS